MDIKHIPYRCRFCQLPLKGGGDCMICNVSYFKTGINYYYDDDIISYIVAHYNGSINITFHTGKNAIINYYFELPPDQILNKVKSLLSFL